MKLQDTKVEILVLTMSIKKLKEIVNQCFEEIG